ncbi:MAG: phosphoribosylamine--glycine ligase, partial [Actinobacteria bacterium]|nr:phosphoribosylamine--glycine ligase [Actinomycetota bacterium]
MKVLVIGSGGREHALTWKIAQSKLLSKLFCGPGNPGTAEVAENIDLKADDITGLLKFAKNESIELTVVGPEAPLAEG